MSAIKPRTAKVTIFQGDDLEHLSRLDAAVTRTEGDVKRAAKSTGVRLMTQADPAESAKTAHEAAKVERDEFAAEAEQRGVVVVMHAQPRRKWRELMGEHGPRDGDRQDEAFGVNIDTMPDALLPISIDRDQSTIDGDLTEFLESLSDYDYYDRLFLTAFALNRGSAVADPTLRLGSEPSPTLPAISS